MNEATALVAEAFTLEERIVRLGQQVRAACDAGDMERALALDAELSRTVERYQDVIRLQVEAGIEGHQADRDRCTLYDQSRDDVAEFDFPTWLEREEVVSLALELALEVSASTPHTSLGSGTGKR